MQQEQRLALEAEPQAARLARAFVRRSLAGLDDDVVDDVVLLTSELVTNVLLHTGSAPVLALVRRPDTVRVTVEDASPLAPRHRRHSTDATTGRGVDLLHRLASDWGWEPTGSGKAVWFERATRG